MMSIYEGITARHAVYDKRAIINFTTEVNDDSVLLLVDYLDNFFDYYKYEEIELRIKSPGGRVSAMNVLIDKINYYIDRGKRIRTRGIGTVASAAAVILTAGSIGFRSVEKYTRILYHSPRVYMTSSEVITIDYANSIAKELEKYEEETKKFLARKATEKLKFLIKQVKNSYKSEDEFRKSITKIAEEFNEVAKRYNLTNQPFLDFKSINLDEIDEKYQRYFEDVFGKLLRQEVYLSPEEAKALLLIDGYPEDLD